MSSCTNTHRPSMHIYSISNGAQYSHISSGIKCNGPPRTVEHCTCCRSSITIIAPVTITSHRGDSATRSDLLREVRKHLIVVIWGWPTWTFVYMTASVCINIPIANKVIMLNYLFRKLRNQLQSAAGSWFSYKITESRSSVDMKRIELRFYGIAWMITRFLRIAPCMHPPHSASPMCACMHAHMGRGDDDSLHSHR